MPIINIDPSQITAARNQGYSDDEIADYLGQRLKQFQDAKDNGYSSTEILDHLSGKQSAPATTDQQQKAGQQFDFTDPNGQRYTVNGPANATADQAFDILQKHLGGQYQNLPPIPPDFQLEHPDGKSPPLPPGFVPEEGPNKSASDTPNTYGGDAKALASGVAKGVLGLPEDAANLWNLGARGLAKLANVAGVPGSDYDPAKDDVHVPAWFNKAKGTIEDQLHTPQNDTERWLDWGGQFAPAIATGPEGLAGKGMTAAAKVLAKRAVLQAAVPAMASNAAGAATSGTELESYARIGAALLAGGLGTKGAAPEAVTSETVSDLANKNFDTFRAAPVTIKPDVVESAAKNIQNDLASSGLSKAPANDFVSQYIGNNKPVSLNQLQETRSLLGKAAKRSDTPEGVAAIRAKQGFDALMDSLTPTDTVVGANALPGAMDALRQGRRNSAVANQLALIEGKQQAGIDNAAVNVTHDQDLATRKQLNSLLKSRAAMRKLSSYEDDIRAAAHGKPLMKAAGKVGDAIGGHNSFLIPILTGEAIGPGVGFGTYAAMYGGGIALRKLAARSTTKQLGNLTNKIASKAVGLPPSRTAAPNNPLLTRALIASLAARGQQQ